MSIESDFAPPGQSLGDTPGYRARIVIIGAGFAGLGLAVRLLQQGETDFLIFERADDVGGVWRDNLYPGCACDVESHLYSLSFAPNPAWSRSFSGQAEIQRYLQALARQYGLYDYVKFGHDFIGAVWDEQALGWRIETSGGEAFARMLVSATGAFSQPEIPAFKGLENFKGKVFHSADWDSRYDLRGRKVAVIGTGASAIQFVPEIQPLVEKLTLFQRTPAWVMPRLDRPLSARERARFARYPLAQRLTRLGIYLRREFFGLGFRHPELMGLYRELALRHMHQAIRDPDLRRLLTPDYTIGCKRILISNAYYPALAQPNVEVLNQPVLELKAHSIVAGDGSEREIDALILGTGFRVTDYAITRAIFGRAGRPLAERWQGSPAAYLGAMVPGFPNFCFLLGPNTGLGHNSVVLMIEAQIAYLLQALAYLDRYRLAALEPREAAYGDFISGLQALSQGTVWLAGGCQSWYLDAQGRNSTLWPGSVGAYRRLLSRFRPGDFRFTVAGKAQPLAQG